MNQINKKFRDLVGAIGNGLKLGTLSAETFLENEPLSRQVHPGELRIIHENGSALPFLSDRFEPKTNARILVVGAGGGIDWLCFRGNGYEVEGIESDRGLARRTNAALQDLGIDQTIAYVPSLKVPEPWPGFDFIFFSREYYSRIAGRETRVALLRSLQSHLVSDGKLFLDFETRNDAEKGQFLDGILPFVIGAPLRKILMRGHPRIQKGDWLDEAGLFLRHRFTRSEMFDELAAADFAIDTIEFLASGGLLLARKKCPLARRYSTLNTDVLKTVS